MTERTVLFLCTGNFYRSRFAESLFNALAAGAGLPWRAASRGLAVERGYNNIGAMAPSAVRALERLGVCVGEDCARMPAPATAADFERAQRVVALKRDEHLPLLRERFPAWAERVEFWHVDDAPAALGRIEQEVRRLVARLANSPSEPEA